MSLTVGVATSSLGGPLLVVVSMIGLGVVVVASTPRVDHSGVCLASPAHTTNGLVVVILVGAVVSGGGPVRLTALLDGSVESSLVVVVVVVVGARVAVTTSGPNLTLLLARVVCLPVRAIVPGLRVFGSISVAVVPVCAPVLADRVSDAAVGGPLPLTLELVPVSWRFWAAIERAVGAAVVAMLVLVIGFNLLSGTEVASKAIGGSVSTTWLARAGSKVDVLREVIVRRTLSGVVGVRVVVVVVEEVVVVVDVVLVLVLGD